MPDSQQVGNCVKPVKCRFFFDQAKEEGINLENPTEVMSNLEKYATCVNKSVN